MQEGYGYSAHTAEMCKYDTKESDHLTDIYIIYIFLSPCTLQAVGGHEFSTARIALSMHASDTCALCLRMTRKLMTTMRLAFEMISP